MRTFNLITLASALFTVALAAPAPAGGYSPFRATIIFIGAAGASYTLLVPTDGTSFAIANPLSISRISSLGGATCRFIGIDGSITVVVGARTVDVGPPQVQIEGSCLAF